MEFLSKQYWQDMKNFVEQIYKKIRFLLNQDEFGATAL